MNSKDKAMLRSMGWKWHKFYITKKVGTYEMAIEFCLKDRCLGIYNEGKSLLEPKIRCKGLFEALLRSLQLEAKYIYLQKEEI